MLCNNNGQNPRTKHFDVCIMYTTGDANQMVMIKRLKYQEPAVGGGGAVAPVVAGARGMMRCVLYPKCSIDVDYYRRCSTWYSILL